MKNLWGIAININKKKGGSKKAFPLWENPPPDNSYPLIVYSKRLCIPIRLTTKCLIEHESEMFLFIINRTTTIKAYNKRCTLIVHFSKNSLGKNFLCVDKSLVLTTEKPYIRHHT